MLSFSLQIPRLFYSSPLGICAKVGAIDTVTLIAPVRYPWGSAFVHVSNLAVIRDFQVVSTKWWWMVGLSVGH